LDQVATFFHMGGYALYVWPCFIVSAGTLLLLYLRSRQRLKTVERELAAAEARRGERHSSRKLSEATEGSLS
jgi:heme exporter protein CcmD